MKRKMRVQGLIKRLREIKEEYGNVEVVTWQQGEFAPPDPAWLIDGARWSLKGFSNDFGQQKRIIL